MGTSAVQGSWVPTSIPQASFPSPQCFPFTPIFLHLSLKEQALTCRPWPSGCWEDVLTSWEGAAPQSWVEEPPAQNCLFSLIPAVALYLSILLSGPNQTPLSSD